MTHVGVLLRPPYEIFSYHFLSPRVKSSLALKGKLRGLAISTVIFGFLSFVFKFVVLFLCEMPFLPINSRTVKLTGLLLRFLDMEGISRLPRLSNPECN